jgi:hypothetical protein
MAALNTADSTGLYLISHRRAILKSGQRLDPDFQKPMTVKLDEDQPDGRMPTFYESPAFIGTQAFLRDLLQAGVDNIETVPVVIRNVATGAENRDYVLMNIVGRVACADMGRSTHRSLGPGMTIMDELVLKPGSFSGLHLFVADEDTDVMIISEQVHRQLLGRGCADIVFRELAVGTA